VTRRAVNRGGEVLPRLRVSGQSVEDYFICATRRARSAATSGSLVAR
jgi:hypothetical protein